MPTDMPTDSRQTDRRDKFAMRAGEQLTDRQDDQKQTFRQTEDRRNDGAMKEGRT